MKKNYYQILQVDQNASDEIIEKAYKTLAKKYHPDTQSEDKKDYAEKIFKQINEAYETLSNPEKRKKYNQLIGQNTISIEEYNKLYNENQNLQNELNNTFNSNLNYQGLNYKHDYNKNYSNKDYNISPKTSLEGKILNLFSFILTIFILFLLWKIPFIRNLIYKMISLN